MTRPSTAARARFHPRAILGVWAWQGAFAVLAGWPVASLARAAYGRDPRGDAPLWSRGGHALMDVLWQDGHGAAAVGQGALLVLGVGALAGLVPLGALLAAMARPRVGGALAHAVQASLRALPALAMCGALVGAGQLAALGAGALVAMLAEGWAHGALGEARAEVLGAAMGLPFAAGAIALGVAHDLARAAVVARRTTWLRGLTVGFGALRCAPLRLAWSWTWRAVVSLAPVALASLLASRLGGRGGLALWLLAVAHQSVLLSRVALRASWLARALRALPQPAVSER